MEEEEREKGGKRKSFVICQNAGNDIRRPQKFSKIRGYQKKGPKFFQKPSAGSQNARCLPDTLIHLL